MKNLKDLKGNPFLEGKFLDVKGPFDANIINGKANPNSNGCSNLMNSEKNLSSTDINNNYFEKFNLKEETLNNIKKIITQRRKDILDILNKKRTIKENSGEHINIINNIFSNNNTSSSQKKRTKYKIDYK